MDSFFIECALIIFLCYNFCQMKKKPRIIIPIWLKLIFTFVILLALTLSVFAYTSYKFILDKDSVQTRQIIQIAADSSCENLSFELKKIQSSLKIFCQSASNLQTDKNHLSQFYKDFTSENPEVYFIYSDSTGWLSSDSFEAAHPDAKESVEFWVSKQNSMLNQACNGSVYIENLSPLFNEGITLLVSSYKDDKDKKTKYCLSGIDSKKLAECLMLPSGADYAVVNSSGVIILSNTASLYLNANPYKKWQEDACSYSLTQSTFDNAIFLSFASPKTSAIDPVIMQLIKLGSITLIPIALAAIILLIMSSRFAYSVKRFGRAAKKIGEENYDVKIRRKSKDEFGYSAWYMNELALKMQEQSRVNTFISGYSNLLAAKKAASGELVLAGVKRNASVLYAGLQNFQTVLSNPSADYPVQLLNDCLAPMTESVEKTGGCVDKFIQDSVLSVWGTVTTTGTPASDAWNAVRAALLMRVGIYEINIKRRQQHTEVLKLQCGINSGTVIAGQIGSKQHLEYTALGNSVTITEQLQKFNEEFKTDILITQSTYDLIRKRIVAEKMPVVLKDGNNSVNVYAVINAIGVKGPANLKELQDFLS